MTETTFLVMMAGALAVPAIVLSVTFLWFDWQDRRATRRNKK